MWTPPKSSGGVGCVLWLPRIVPLFLCLYPVLGWGSDKCASSSTDGGCVRVLCLYSGPHRPDDGLAKFVEELGAECVCVDKEFNNDHDLLYQNFRDKSARMNFGSSTASWFHHRAVPFTPARRGQGGPRPLRGTKRKSRSQRATF